MSCECGKPESSSLNARCHFCHVFNCSRKCAIQCRYCIGDELDKDTDRYNESFIADIKRSYCHNTPDGLKLQRDRVKYMEMYNKLPKPPRAMTIHYIKGLDKHATKNDVYKFLGEMRREFKPPPKDYFKYIKKLDKIYGI